MDVEALAEAQTLLRRFDPGRWRTTLFAKAAERPRLVALYAFNVEIARVRETVSEAILGQIRLQWWREALAEIAAGGAVRRHPIVRAVADAKLDPAALGRLVDARERDLDDAAFADLAELEAHAGATSGDLASVAGGEACRDIGTAYALAGSLMALPHFSRQRRNVLPTALVEAAGLTPETIHEGKAGAKLEAAVLPVAKRARELLVNTDNVPNAVALQGTIAKLWLDRLQRARHDAFAPGLQKPYPADIWRLFFANLFGRF
ncbi:MAG: squalene/phytoene synthase family protein [Rhodospirillales bacterium]|nr:squalene/phytoene synthase family protein [Rhodospirillales bacterium]